MNPVEGIVIKIKTDTDLLPPIIKIDNIVYKTYVI